MSQKHCGKQTVETLITLAYIG